MQRGQVSQQSTVAGGRTGYEPPRLRPTSAALQVMRPIAPSLVDGDGTTTLVPYRVQERVKVTCFLRVAWQKKSRL